MLTRVFLKDLRNHGDSPHDPRHDYKALAEDVEEFLDHHKLANVALIGHSMLGNLCLGDAMPNQ